MKLELKGLLKALLERIQGLLCLFHPILPAHTKDSSNLPLSDSLLPIQRIVKKVLRVLHGVVGRPSVVSSTEDTALTPSESVEVCCPTRSGVPVRALEFPVMPLIESLHNENKPTTIYYSVEPYCVLCRKTLPEPKDYNSKKAEVLPNGRSDFWQYKIQVVVCMDISPSPATGPHTKFLAVELNLTKYEKVAKPGHLIGLDKEQTMLADIHIKRPKLRDLFIHRRREAYPVHRSCWKLAKTYSKHPYTNKLIYQFGRSTKDLAVTPRIEDIWKTSIRDLTPFLASLDQEVGIARLLYCLSRSPAEIENAITDISPNNLLSSAIGFVRSTLPLLQSISHTGVNQSEITSLIPSFRFMTAQTIKIYSQTYLRELKVHEQETQERSLPLHPLRGVQIGPGAHGTGIGSLKLLYEDGSESPWLGTYPGEQIMTILGNKITGLKIERDELKITRIDLVANKSWHIHQPEGFMKPKHLRYSCRYRKSYTAEGLNSNDPSNGWRTRHTSKRNSNNWRLARCLQLKKEEGYVKAITVYCYGASVCGIAAHDVSTEMVGSRGQMSCAIFIPLQKDEELASIWSSRAVNTECRPWESDRCPTILMTTNQKRTRMCAPVWHSELSEWRPISNDLEASIITIFSDGIEKIDGSMLNIGITKDNPFSKVMLDKTMLPSIPVPKKGTVPHHEEWRNAFVSIATFNKVEKIEARKRGSRYLGLLIYHLDDLPIEVLGQWDPAFPSEITTIYEETEGPIQEICFQYAIQSGDGWKHCSDSAKSFVSAIYIRIGGTPNIEDEKSMGETFHWVDLTEPIAWWFTWFADCVQGWEGEFEKVSYKAGKEKELFLNLGLDLPEHEGDPGFVLHDEDDNSEEDDE